MLTSFLRKICHKIYGIKINNFYVYEKITIRFVPHILNEIENQIEKIEKSLVIITGYVAKEALIYMDNMLKGKNIQKTILFKLDLFEFHRGVSTFDFNQAFDKGWKINVDSSDFTSRRLGLRAFSFSCVSVCHIDRILLMFSRRLYSRGYS